MNKDKERTQTRERVRRYREKQKSSSVTASQVTPVTAVKLICKCKYFKCCNGQLICVQCGRPAPAKKIEDKIKRGINLK
jgi:hypothetical protein